MKRKYLCGVCFSSLFALYTIYEKFMLPELQIPMLVSILYVAIFVIFYKAGNVLRQAELCSKISYVIFSVFMVLGDSFKTYGSLFGIWGNPFRNSNVAEELLEEFSEAFAFLNGGIGNGLMVLNSISKGIGYYFIILCAFELLKYFVRRYSSALPKEYERLIDNLFNEKGFLKIFLFLAISWLPYLLIKFPASVSNDAMSQIHQFISGKITTHHSFLTTLIFGGFAKLGLFMGNENIGLCIYTLIQYTCMAIAFAYCITRIDRLGKKHFFSFLLLLLFAFSPAVPNYATTIVKDAPYITFFVLYITHMIQIVYNIENKYTFGKELLLLGICAVFLCAIRNNGIYVVAPTIVVFSCYLLLGKGKSRKQCFASVALLMMPLFFCMGYHFLQYDVLKLEKGSIKEALSIPFQQTARYVKEHPEDVTAEDAEIIDRVLDYENLAELYNPVVSDPVKATYKKNDDALRDYFNVWFKHFKKHPVTYIEATMHTNYYAVYPDEANTRIYGTIVGDSKSLFGKTLQLMLMVVAMGISCVPIASCLVNPVFYIWLFIYLSLYFIFHKRYLQLLLVLPLFLQFLTVLAGPAVLNHPRYIYPICWSVPFIAVYAAQKRETE